MYRNGIRLTFVVPVAAALALAACSNNADRADTVAAVPRASQSAEGAGESADESAVAASETNGEPDAVRRFLPLALRSESNIPTNSLPSVEVHDVGQDRMVNFRNIFPAERPVLLWMWAPF